MLAVVKAALWPVLKGAICWVPSAPTWAELKAPTCKEVNAVSNAVVRAAICKVDRLCTWLALNTTKSADCIAPIWFAVSPSNWLPPQAWICSVVKATTRSLVKADTCADDKARRTFAPMACKSALSNAAIWLVCKALNCAVLRTCHCDVTSACNWVVSRLNMPSLVMACTCAVVKLAICSVVRCAMSCVDKLLILEVRSAANALAESACSWANDSASVFALVSATVCSEVSAFNWVVAKLAS